jgi:hypothetical protein
MGARAAGELDCVPCALATARSGARDGGPRPSNGCCNDRYAARRIAVDAGRIHHRAGAREHARACRSYAMPICETRGESRALATGRSGRCDTALGGRSLGARWRLRVRRRRRAQKRAACHVDTRPRDAAAATSPERPPSSASHPYARSMPLTARCRPRTYRRCTARWRQRSRQPPRSSSA